MKEKFEKDVAEFLKALGDDAAEYIRIQNKVADIFSARNWNKAGEGSL